MLSKLRRWCLICRTSRRIPSSFDRHNAEAEAIDLLMEIGRIDELVQYIDKTNSDRISTYLAQVSSYVPEPEDGQVLAVAVAGLRKLGKHPEALLMAVGRPAAQPLPFPLPCPHLSLVLLSRSASAALPLILHLFPLSSSSSHPP